MTPRIAKTILLSVLWTLAIVSGCLLIVNLRVATDNLKVLYESINQVLVFWIVLIGITSIVAIGETCINVLISNISNPDL